MAKRELSSQAQVAKLLKQFCKSKGVKCRAVSDSFSMGDSVNVTVYDQPPEVFAAIKAEASQYQYGSFDGMTDSYNYDNRNKDIPQSKWVDVSNEFSDEIKQAAWTVVRERFSNGEDWPEDYADSRVSHIRWHNEWASDLVYRLLSGALSHGDLSAAFWRERGTPTHTASETPAAIERVGSVQIEEHTHTKKNFQMFIVILSERVSRETFTGYLEQARGLGGWYSRKWGTTPAGFAFKERDKAEEFAGSIGGSETPPEGPTTPTGPANDNPGPNDTRPRTAKKLRDLAEGMTAQIEDKFRDRLTNTPKRQREAACARLDGERLQRTQTVLAALADMHEAGTVPPILATVTTKKAVFECMGSEKDTSQRGYYDAPICTGRPSRNDPTTLALWALISPKSAEDIAADELRRKLEGVRFSKIPGYFPTAAALVARMIDKADIWPGHKVLETSAGCGRIVDAVRAKEPTAEIICYEVNYSLREILTLKGYAPRRDYIEDTDTTPVDRVVINPPFEQLQDIDHVRKAYDQLAEGGRLVAIMSQSPFFNSQRKAVEFREWFANLDGWTEDIPADAFKESGTSVSTRLVVIDKPRTIH